MPTPSGTRPWNKQHPPRHSWGGGRTAGGGLCTHLRIVGCFRHRGRDEESRARHACARPSTHRERSRSSENSPRRAARGHSLVGTPVTTQATARRGATVPRVACAATVSRVPVSPGGGAQDAWHGTVRGAGRVAAPGLRTHFSQLSPTDLIFSAQLQNRAGNFRKHPFLHRELSRRHPQCAHVMCTCASQGVTSRHISGAAVPWMVPWRISISIIGYR